MSNITLAFLARFLGLSTQAGLIGYIDKRDSDLIEAYIGALTLKAGSNSKLASNIIIEFVHRTLGGLFRKLIQNRNFFSHPHLSIDRKIEYHITLINYFYSVDDSFIMDFELYVINTEVDGAGFPLACLLLEHNGKCDNGIRTG
ncbi:hypothetical protein RhiirA4_442767 [Rhizophagus irregularis]|uniref:Uncharacterized protein n=1 Tax=Rhizophagus irregularis TaxID=588596 RepID=A0A2I1GAZ5_9GLOM|nr:hypothetical protein RhiirA4_442767 [Rhizophagus irregularis]